MGANAGRMDVQIDEARFDRGQSMIRQMRMGGSDNPLINYFSNDRPVMELRLDLDDRLSKAKNQACMPLAPLIALPCFWPHLCIISAICTICGTPCDFMMCAEGRMEKMAGAHKLVLRERSLHYVVETHMQTPMCMPLICNLCTPGQTIDRFEEVYPLDMVTWSGVVPAVKQVCNQPAGPDTFIVKVNNGVHPAVAIDGPQNADEFIEKLNQQKEIMTSETLPPDVEQQFQSYIMTTSSGMGAFMTMMNNRPQGKQGAHSQAMQMQMMQQAMAQSANGGGGYPTNMAMNRGGMGGMGMATAGVVEMSDVAVAMPAGVAVATAAPAVHPKLQGFSVEDVAASLTSLGLSQYADRFKAERIDGRALGDLDEGVLETDLGVGSSLHRRKIMRWIQEGN